MDTTAPRRMDATARPPPTTGPADTVLIMPNDHQSPRRPTKAECIANFWEIAARVHADNCLREAARDAAGARADRDGDSVVPYA